MITLDDVARPVKVLSDFPCNADEGVEVPHERERQGHRFRNVSLRSSPSYLVLELQGARDIGRLAIATRAVLGLRTCKSMQDLSY